MSPDVSQSAPFQNTSPTNQNYQTTTTKTPNATHKQIKTSNTNKHTTKHIQYTKQKRNKSLATHTNNSVAIWAQVCCRRDFCLFVLVGHVLLASCPFRPWPCVSSGEAALASSFATGVCCRQCRCVRRLASHYQEALVAHLPPLGVAPSRS